MNPADDESHAALREMVRKIVRTDQTPPSTDASVPSPVLFERLREGGLWEITLPENFGGSDLDPLAAVVLLEELAMHSGVLAGAVAVQEIVLSALARSSQENVSFAKVLRSPCSAWVYRGAEGPWRGWGQTQGGVVVAQEGGSFRVVHDHPLNRQTAMGMDGLSVVAHELPKTSTLDQMASTELQSIADRSIAAVALGIGGDALRRARIYARERRQFGRPISEFQAIAEYIANGEVKLDATRCLLHRAACSGSAGDASSARLYAVESAVWVADAALQIHGGYGYTREFQVEACLRNAIACRDGFGTTDAVRQQVAARYTA
ncbi:MAG: acyl-CoA dehydrogenase family protein [Myxococcota bacterium]